MKEEEFDALWEELKDSWDTEEPIPGHRERFERRLSESSAGEGHARIGNGGFKLKALWSQIAVAASIALVLGLWIGQPSNANRLPERVSEISPEASRSAFYFAGIIEEQIRELEDAQTPETAPMVRATLDQIRILENDYVRLEEELVKGGNTQLILKAMVTNFQTRIDLLNDVLEQINEFKLLNTQNNEELSL